MTSRDQAQELYADKDSFGRPTVGVALFISFALISVPPILFFGAWLSQQQSQVAVERFNQEASTRAQSVEEAVREYIRLKREVLNVTAGTLSVMPLWHLDELQAITDAQIKSSASFDSFYVGNPKGKSIVFAPSIRTDGSQTIAGVDYSDRDYFQRLIKTKRIALGNMKLGRQSRVANVHVAVPIYSDLDLKEKGDLRGFIVGGIKTKLIEQVMRRTIKGRDRFRATLVEVNDRVVGDSDGEIPIYTLLPKESLFSRSCETTESTLGYNLRKTEIRALCRTVNIESIRWTLWISSPQELIVAEANKSINLTMKIAIFLLLGVVLVAAFLSSWVSRLMGLITMNAQRVSEGHFEITLPAVRWFTPREVVEVGNISLETLARVRESDERVRGLVDNLEVVNRRLEPLAEAWRQVSEAIEILGPKGEVLFVNPAYYELHDINEQAETLQKQSLLFKLTSEAVENRSVGEVILGHAHSGLSWSGEVDCETNTKRRVHNINSSPIFDQKGELVRVVVIRRDITEERIAQASAAHNDRLAAIGTLAAGLAHEINNPMTYIKMSLDLIQESLEELEEEEGNFILEHDLYDELKDATSDASEGVNRVTSIVRSLLSIARSGGERGEGERMSQVNLYEVIQACSNLVKPEFSKRVQLIVESNEVLHVLGRRSELIQVILNLLINAAQAMPIDRDGGHWVKIKTETLENGRVVLIVSDNASGIPSDDLEHIFEPFFSSKPVGKGTGLGLAVSRGIIEAHHATMTVASKLGEGTSFTISFPSFSHFPDQTDTMVGLPEPLLVEKTPESRHAIQVTSSDPSDQEQANRRRRILLVDDDLLVAKSLARMLRDEIVMIASDGQQALNILKSYSFDLILSDVMMPKMDGPTFYRHVSVNFPQYCDRFVFITGAAKGSEVIAALNETGCLILNKPITKKKLISVVERQTR